jgi:cytochrome c
MDSFELNKIIGAVLGTLLFVMGAGFVAEAIYHPIEGRGPGYNLPEPAPVDTAAAAPAAAAVPLGVLLASASADNGAKAVKKCQSCHNFGAGEPNKTGPLLYDVVDRPIGSHEGFAYSAGMEDHKAKGDIWSFENLDAFLTSPKTFTPGTKMTFAGISSPQERADVLAYLQTLSPSPKPFPPAEAAPDAGSTPTPAVDNTTPGTTEAPPAVDTPPVTQSETPVQGTKTNTETPAGSATPPPANTQVPAKTAPAAPAAAPAGPAPAAPPATPGAAPATH